VAAVVVSNFTNHLYVLAEDFCKKEEVDFALLAPLIKETAERIVHFSPAAVQTGPAARNDIFTIDKHLLILSDHPQLKNMYIKLTDSIMKW
jgi:F420-dependent methylenetetrahydromethanopterin dehydrogenase